MWSRASGCLGSNGCGDVPMRRESPISISSAREAAEVGQGVWGTLGVSTEVVRATQHFACPTDKDCAALAAQSNLEVILSQIVFDFIWSAM